MFSTHWGPEVIYMNYFVFVLFFSKLCLIFLHKINNPKADFFFCRFNVLLDRCYATALPFHTDTTFHDLFIG